MWCGHTKRRVQEQVGRKTLEMVPSDRRRRGSPTERWMDCVNQDMRAIGTTKDEVHNITGWMILFSVCHSDPTIKWERLEEEKEEVYD